MLDIKLDVKNKGNIFSQNEEINKAIRILPSKETEGFFIAKLRKI